MLLIQQTLDYIYFIVLCDAFYCVCCSKPVTDNIQPFVNLHENESLYLEKKKEKGKKASLVGALCYRIQSQETKCCYFWEGSKSKWPTRLDRKSRNQQCLKFMY